MRFMITVANSKAASGNCQILSNVQQIWKKTSLPILSNVVARPVIFQFIEAYHCNCFDSQPNISVLETHGRELT